MLTVDNLMRFANSVGHTGVLTSDDANAIVIDPANARLVLNAVGFRETREIPMILEFIDDPETDDD